MKLMNFSIYIFILLTGLAFTNTTLGADRHSGYYYPPPKQIEIYKARAKTLLNTNRSRRIEFVTAITFQRLKRPYPPPTIFFAKGEQAQKFIIVALQDGPLDTIYRVRAYLASLTATARTTPIFQELDMDENFTFFDLAKMLGFEQITVSDGKSFTHQVKFEE